MPGFRASDGFEIAILENPKQVRLERCRELTDLVQKQPAAIRELEAARQSGDFQRIE
jgi:hypothetical protein